MNTADEFKNNVIKLFQYYKSLGDACFAQMSYDEMLFWSPNENSNSIAVIVQHLHGNMLSRWTDFLTTDGEKEWRKRDQEFVPALVDKNEVITKWEEGWHCLFKALKLIDNDILNSLVYIRNMGQPVWEAVQRQIAHYSYHVGQIVYLSKLQIEDWKSLSIAKGQSEEFNKDKFSKTRLQKHFIDDMKDSIHDKHQ